LSHRKLAATTAVVIAAAAALVLYVLHLQKVTYPASHVVTVEELRRSLDHSGLTVRYLRAPAGVVAGWASGDGDGRVGFEFVVAKKRPATTDLLGHAPLPLNDGQPTAADTDHEIDPLVRGIISNVAYASYFFGRFPDSDANSRISRALDDALFGLFPRGDPAAWPRRAP
jgi:hypothetical protein